MLRRDFLNVSVLGLILAFFTFLFPEVSLAQNPPTNFAQENGGFIYWWLFPLAMVPLAFLLFKDYDKKDREEEEDSRLGQQEIAYHDIDKDKKTAKTPKEKEKK